MAGSIALFLSAALFSGDSTLQKVKACTVQVAGQKDFGTQRIVRQGSGFVVDDAGLIVTCWHVVSECRSIEVRLADGRTYPARIVGCEPKQDLALLETSRRSRFYLSTEVENPSAEPGASTFIAGYAGEVLCSIVDATIRGPEKQVEMLHVSPGTPLVRFEGAIRPGFSGGPMVHADGRLLGVVIGQSRRTPADGFAVPDSAVIHLLHSIGRKERTPERKRTAEDSRPASLTRQASNSPAVRFFHSLPLED